MSVKSEPEVRVPRPAVLGAAIAGAMSNAMDANASDLAGLLQNQEYLNHRGDFELNVAILFGSLLVYELYLRGK